MRQELIETLYHVLWELVHVFFDHVTGPRHDTGASSFLYPFLNEQPDDLEGVVADVRESVMAKAVETSELRAATMGEFAPVIAAAAATMRDSFGRGGRLLALGNGGSATDAMDAVADLCEPPDAWPARPGLDLTEDAGIVTAIANDVGFETVFARQVIAHGRPEDVLLAFSTSGGSSNVLAALAEARRRGLRSIALLGYDGGEIARDGLADHVVIARSQHIPRIQEAQATVWHALRAAVER
jgi:D-sedoheptulose 7-phosphate isomerase